MVYPPQMRVLSALNSQLVVAGCKEKETSDARRLINTFCTRNSIHAINNFLRESTGTYERLIWFIVMTLTVFGLVYVSLSLSHRYDEGTFQTVVASTTYPVYQILFPTVTICNKNRLNWKRLGAAKERFLPGEKDQRKLELFARFVAAFDGMMFGNFDDFGNVSDTNLTPLDGINFTNAVTFMTWTCEELLVDCKWRYENFDCCNDFEMQRSELGLCYAFNGIESKKSRNRQKSDKFYPLRNSNSGPKSGLQVRVLIRPQDHVPAANEQEKGVFVMFHEPEVWYTDPFFIPWNTQSSAEIDPVIYYFDNDTKIVPAALRKCYFKDELQGEDFKTLPDHVYMIENCISQCHQEHLLRYCNCTMDLLFPQGDYHTCQASDFQCIYNHRDLFRYTKRKGEEEYVFNRHQGMTCKCFRNCFSLNYINEVRVTYLPANIINNSAYVDLDIYYRFNSIVLYRTSLVFGWLDLIVSFGGIAGLFLGCSLISGVEIIYFLCVDIPKYIYCRFKRRKIIPRTPTMNINQQQLNRWANGFYHHPSLKLPRQYNRHIFRVAEQNYK